MRKSEHKQTNREMRSGSGVWSSGGPYKKRNRTTQRQTEDREADTSGRPRNERKQSVIPQQQVQSSLTTTTTKLHLIRSGSRYTSIRVRWLIGGRHPQREPGGRSGSAASNAIPGPPTVVIGRRSASRGIGVFSVTKAERLKVPKSDSWR